MDARLIALDALTADDLAAWEALAARALVPNPFFEPGFVLTAARELGSGDERLIAAGDDRGWHACLPVRTGRRGRRVPVRHAGTWLSLYCFLGTALLDGVDPDAALAACLAVLAGETRDAALRLPIHDDAGPAFDALGRPVVLERYARAALHRRAEGGYLEASVSSRHRKELRRTRRHLEDEVGALAVRDAAGDPAAVESFLALERSGWKGRGGTALASDAAHARFFRELAATYAAAGRLQLLLLENPEGRAVAAKCNVRAGDGILCFKIAHDDALRRHSPGIHLEVENMSWFHENTDADWMDSCAAPDNAMINRLWPDRRRLATLLVPVAGHRGRAARGTVAVTSTLRTLRNQLRRTST